METIKQTLLTGWHLMRGLRLAFGVFFVVQAVQANDLFFGIAGAFFLLSALTNTGCCATGSCAAPNRRSRKEELEEISFEEIKNK